MQVALLLAEDVFLRTEAVIGLMSQVSQAVPPPAAENDGAR